MTDNEIIKALECCIDWCGTISCWDCPLKNTGCIHFDKLKETLDLINRQKAEIEMLRDASIDNEYANCVAVKNGLIYTHTLDDYDKLIGDISAEAIKEFEKRVVEKTLAMVYSHDLLSTENYVECIQSVRKEMVGDV